MPEFIHVLAEMFLRLDRLRGYGLGTVSVRTAVSCSALDAYSCHNSMFTQYHWKNTFP